MGVFLCVGAAAETVSESEVYEWLRSGGVWIPGVTMHVLLWVVCERARRTTRGTRRAWMVALVPAPVFVYSVAGLCWLVLMRVNAVTGWQLGALVGLAYIGVVMRAAWMLRHNAAASDAAHRALQFAGAVNLSAVLLVPLHRGSDGSHSLTQFVDARATLAALGVTVALIGASFLFHRYRRSA